MGLRYRKSINLGGGFRVNISKRGVGYSWGVKGARITKTARGTTRRTLSIPGTGISHSDETTSKKRRGNGMVKNSYQPVNNQYNPDVLPSISTETINVSDYQPSEHKELLDSLKKIQNLNLLSTILICTFALFIIPIFIVTGIIGIALKIYIHTKMGIPLEYEFDRESRQSYDDLCAVWMSLNDNNRFWQTISTAQIQNQKAHGGAKASVTRIPAKAINKAPYFIKPNVELFGLQLRAQQLIFLPDKLLVASRRKIGAVNYDDVRMRLGTTRFIETGHVPSDAKIVGKTWLKVNKNGTPDKRYKDNKQVPICE